MKMQIQFKWDAIKTRILSPITVALVVILMIVGDFYIIQKYDGDSFRIREEEIRIGREILLNAGFSPDLYDRYGPAGYYYDKDHQVETAKVASIIAASLRSQALSELSDKRRRAERLSTVFAYILTVLPLLFLSTLVWGGTHLWRGEGLDVDQLRVRRQRIRVLRTIFIVIILAPSTLVLTILSNNYSYRYPSNFELYLLVYFFIAANGLGALFVWSLWDLLSSKTTLGFISKKIKFAPVILRTSTQLLVAGIITGIVAGFRGNQPAWLAFTMVLLVGSIGTAIMGYLRVPSSKLLIGSKQNDKEVAEDQLTTIEEGSTYLAELRKVEIEALSHKEDMELTIFRQKAELELFKEKMKAELELKELEFKVDAAKQLQISSVSPPKTYEIVRERSQITRERLLSEIQSLTRRGNVNLMIGSITTLIAAGILYLLVKSAPNPGATTAAVVEYYVPRISIAVFVEVFSFFFLRLYRNGLSEILYFQNELTNIESKMLAIEVATMLNSSKEMGALLRELSATDRNYVIKKGESTVELEKMKLDQQNLKSSIDTLVSKISDTKLLKSEK